MIPLRTMLFSGTLLLTLVTADAQQPSTMGGARYSTPAGWSEDRKTTIHTYTHVSGRDVCVLAVYRDEASPPALAEAFTNAWRGAFRAPLYRPRDVPPWREERSPRGYRHVTGEGDLEDSRGNRWFARLRLFPVGVRTQTIVFVGNSREALDGCRSDWDAFYSSLEFPGEVASAAPQQAEPREKPSDAAPTASRPATSPPASLISAPETFDNITFVAPAGWSTERTGAVVSLSPSSLLPGESLRVILLPGRRSSEPLPREFAATWNEVASMFGATSMRTVNGTAYDLDEPARSRRGWDYLSGTGGIRRADGSTGSFAVTLYVIRAGDRVERVAVVARDFRLNLSTINAAQNPVHDRAIRSMIFALRFANVRDTTFAPMRITKGNGVAGVWAGITMSFGNYKTTYAILFDDGTAFFGPNFPVRGLHQIDPSIEQPEAPRYWGTYSASGAGGEIRVPYGAVPFRVTARGLDVTTSGTAHRFIRLESPTAAQLTGRWCLASGPCIRFDADGRFLDEGAARVMEHAVYDYPETPARGEGQFAVEDHTLILRFDRAPEIRIAIPGVSEGPAARLGEIPLGFNLDMLVRR